jgi:ParB family chromosome partitioning protein
MPRKKKIVRRRKVAPGSTGLSPKETAALPGPSARELAAAVESDGGSVVGHYRDPFGVRDLVLAVLPVDLVEPTPYQRDASDAHMKRLMNAIEKIGSFLDPIVAIRHGNGYWTPNGNHRLKAMKKLGAKSITALLVPEPEIAFKILALNTEKAHNLREKSLETIRMLKALAEESSRNERDFAFEFEDPVYLTLGLCYEARPRFSGGAYQPVLRRVDDFQELQLKKALVERERRAKIVLQLDEAVSQVVRKLKDRGLESPYLKAFVVARINPTRFPRAPAFDFDEVFEKMISSAARFKVDKIRQEDVARSSGPPPEPEE